MKSKLLIATTAAALAAGTYYAVAQSANQPASSARGSGSMSQSAPSGAEGRSGATEKSTQDKGSPDKGAMDKRAQDTKSSPSTSGQAPSSAQSQAPSGAAQDKGGSSASSPSQRSGSDSQRSQSGSSPSTAQSPSASSPSQRTGSDTQQSQSGSSNNSAQSPSGSSSSPSSAQAPAASGSASANLSTEQRTQIRQAVISQSNAPRVTNVNFSLSVGTVVPRTVHVVTVPETIVRIHPAWRGYSYFIVNDDIVIVEPGTLRIIAVIPA